MNSGFLLHLSITSLRNLSGSFTNFSIYCSSENTQYFSLNLNTPRLGFPGISKEFSTIFTKQKPKKSRGICIKSGVVLGINLIMEGPTTYDSIV